MKLMSFLFISSFKGEDAPLFHFEIDKENFLALDSSEYNLKKKRNVRNENTQRLEQKV